MSDKTIAQQLKIKKFPFNIRDDNDNIIYHENSDGVFEKQQYDDYGNKVYYEDSDGYWCKSEFDDNGNHVYHESSSGYIRDNRPYRKAIDKVAKARKLLKQAEKELKEVQSE